MGGLESALAEQLVTVDRKLFSSPDATQANPTPTPSLEPSPELVSPEDKESRPAEEATVPSVGPPSCLLAAEEAVQVSTEVSSPAGILEGVAQPASPLEEVAAKEEASAPTARSDES